MKNLTLLATVVALVGAPMGAFAEPAPAAPTLPIHTHVEQLVPMACFAQGSDPALVEKAHVDFWEHRLRTSVDAPHRHGSTKFTFSDGDRWTSTATDGGGLSQGDPMTLTCSIVPDGTSIFGYNGEPTAPSNVRAWLNGIYGSQAVWLPIFEGVFDRWSELNGVTYVYEPNDDGSAWTSTNIAAGQLGVRGDVRISGHFIDGNSNVLAYNFFPNFGDMVLDTADNTYNNLANNSLILRNILAHEHGHGLGLAHVCPVNQTKLMEPFLATAFDGPQFDDILATNRGYGDALESNDTPGSASSVGSIAFGGGVALDTVSVDDNSDTDVYSFSVSGATSVDVNLTPVGGTYLSGPQNPNGSCTPGTSFNAGDNQNLRLEVLGTNGTTVLASADNTGAGSSESVSGVALPGAGTYFVEVGGPNNEAQLYELAIDVGSGGGGGGGVDTIQYATVRSDERVRTVNVNGFTSPRIVAGPPSFAGNQACTTRLTNVTASSFVHQIIEWDYLDGAHANENLGYIALEDGPQTLGSLDADAGTANVTNAWTTVSFSQSFGAAPVVITQVASNNDSTPVTTRIRNVTANSFQVQLEEQEANNQSHVAERVDWIAVELGSTTFGGDEMLVGRTGNTVDEVWETINFGQSVTGPTFVAAMQTTNGGDTATLRHRNLSATSVEVLVQEEQSANAEVGHVNEVVGYIVIGDP
ncbi:MAG: matrixin family metalloprotease [Acidobacteriota bacterium]